MDAWTAARPREIGLALDTPRPGARGDDDEDDDDEEEDDDDDVRYWLTASMTLMHLQWCQSFQLIVVPPSLSRIRVRAGPLTLF